ncbi:hypothetical protein BH10BAC2_BH10BAC2_22970 [soil metagenome]
MLVKRGIFLWTRLNDFMGSSVVSLTSSFRTFHDQYKNINMLPLKAETKFYIIMITIDETSSIDFVVGTT